jgi:DNA-binding protein HU-beta
MRLNKKDMIEKIQEELKRNGVYIKNTVVDQILKTEQSVIASNLEQKGVVAYMNFGTFDTYERSERQGTNPQTGEPMTIAAATIPRFKPGKGLKNFINGKTK